MRLPLTVPALHLWHVHASMLGRPGGAPTLQAQIRTCGSLDACSKQALVC